VKIEITTVSETEIIRADLISTTGPTNRWDNRSLQTERKPMQDNVFYKPPITRRWRQIFHLLKTDPDIEAKELYCGHSDVIFILMKNGKLVLSTWYNGLWDSVRPGTLNKLDVIQETWGTTRCNRNEEYYRLTNLAETEEPDMVELTKSYGSNETETSKLKYGIIEVSTRCQMRCPGCYMVRRNALNNKDMTLKQAIRILDLCRDYCGWDLDSMDILGGEPLLWPHLKEYIEELLRRKIAPWIYTNMLGITPELARWLYDRNVHITGKLNIADFQDPIQVELQAKMIGSSEKTALKMKKGIEIFKEAGYTDPMFRLQNLIRKENIHLIPDFMIFCQKNNIGIDLELMASGETVGPDYFKVAPTAKEIADLVIEIERRGKEFITQTFDPMPHYPIPHQLEGARGKIFTKQEDADLLIEIERIDKEYRTQTEGLTTEYDIPDQFRNTRGKVLMPHLFGSCPFYDKGLYFGVDGHIKACSNSTIQLSHVNEENPIEKALLSELLCNRRCLTQENIGEPCHSCHKWDLCRGGCRATAEGLGGSFGGYTLCPVPYL